jgi:hypothetical protein
MLRVGGGLLPGREPPASPIFILGSPRSGTTLLFDVLRRSSSLSSLTGESHLLWESFHDPSRPGWASHALGASDVTRKEQRFIYWAIDRVAEGRRYLDKSPRNCFRVPYLNDLFPDARFVFLKRDGRAAVSSLISGWRSDSTVFGGVEVGRALEIRGYGGDTWRFVAPPGWEALATGSTLEEVCAFQWSASNDAVLAAREAIDQDRWSELTYEAFVEAPGEMTARLLERLRLPVEDAVLDYARELDRNVTKVAVTAPRPDKWRQEHPAEIQRVLPLISPTMRRLGYALDGEPPTTEA